MKLIYLNKFLLKRYLKFKFVNIIKTEKFYFIKKIRCDIVFIGLNNIKNKLLLSSYLFLLDFFYYKAPFILKSRIMYRGKLTVKVTLLSIIISEKNSLEIFLKEFFYFIFLRNFEFRQLFLRNLNDINSHLIFNGSLRLFNFFYTIRPFSHLSNLPKNSVLFNFFFSDFTNETKIIKHNFFMLFFSFLFFLFEDNFKS